MISMNDIDKLHTAEKVTSVALTAYDDQLTSAVAKSINLTANTGEFRVVWRTTLPKTLINKLQLLGYKVEIISRLGDTMYNISWGDE